MLSYFILMDHWNETLNILQTAYLTASLLIDPKSELTILLTATIQRDLKSDNFLIGTISVMILES